MRDRSTPDAPFLARLSRPALVAIAVGLAVCAGALAFVEPQWCRSYLVACLFWLAISLGCWSWKMLHNLTGGGWGWTTRPALDAAAATLPLMALLFLPLLVSLEALYVWARPLAVA